MSISTLADLKSAVAQWSHRADTSGFIDNLISVAERNLFRVVKSRELEYDLNVAVSSGVAAIPPDFVSLKHAYLDGAPTLPLEPKPAWYIYQNYPARSVGGMPAFIAVDGNNFIFGPYAPDGTLKGVYYRKLTSVLDGGNDLFTNNPDLYLFACLAELAPFQKDDARVQLWVSKRDQLLMTVNGEAKRAAGGPMSQSATPRGA